MVRWRRLSPVLRSDPHRGIDASSAPAPIHEGVDERDPIYDDLHIAEQSLKLLVIADRVDLLRRAPHQNEAAQVSVV